MTDREWENLIAVIAERTGVSRGDVEKVLDAQNDYWYERPELVDAIFDSYDEGDDSYDEDDE